MTLYDDLGVSGGASESEIKAAHRKAVRGAHPDAGGSPEAFERVQRAWLVLSDPDRRRHYDETGQADESPKSSEDELVHSMVAQVIMEFLGGAQDLARTDIISIAGRALSERRKAHQTNQAQIDGRLRRIAVMRERLTCKAGENLFAPILENQEQALRGGRAQEDQNIRVVDRALEALKSYAYRVDPSAGPPGFQWGGADMRSALGLGQAL